MTVMGRRARDFRNSCNRYQKYQPIKACGIKFVGCTASASGELGLLTWDDWMPKLDLESAVTQNDVVLDLGCNIGSVCFEAARLGASYVTGVDKESMFINCAKKWRGLMAEDGEFYMNERVHFMQKDILDIDEVADVVIFCNVLHHMKKPMEALRFVFERTKKTAILEVQLHDHRIAGEELKTLSGVEIKRKKANSDFGLGYYPTLGAVTNALKDIGFSEVQIKGTGKLDHRAILHAQV